MFGGLAQTLAGLGQNRSDGILGDPQLLTDLPVILILEVVKPNNFRFPFREIAKHSLNLLGRDDRLGFS